MLRNEQHGGVHMRGFEHVDALPIEVEWTSPIGKWVHPVGASCSHHHEVTVFDDVSLPVSGMFAGSDRSKINDICRELQCFAVTVPQGGASPKKVRPSIGKTCDKRWIDVTEPGRYRGRDGV